MHFTEFIWILILICTIALSVIPFFCSFSLNCSLCYNKNIITNKQIFSLYSYYIYTLFYLYLLAFKIILLISSSYSMLYLVFAEHIECTNKASYTPKTGSLNANHCIQIDWMDIRMAYVCAQFNQILKLRNLCLIGNRDALMCEQKPARSRTFWMWMRVHRHACIYQQQSV